MAFRTTLESRRRVKLAGGFFTGVMVAPLASHRIHRLSSLVPCLAMPARFDDKLFPGRAVTQMLRRSCRSRCHGRVFHPRGQRVRILRHRRGTRHIHRVPLLKQPL